MGNLIRVRLVGKRWNNYRSAGPEHIGIEEGAEIVVEVAAFRSRDCVYVINEEGKDQDVEVINPEPRAIDPGP